MKINRLTVSAFRAFNKQESFDLSAAVILLSGNNGYGKTSFFDAVEWAFTGKLIRYEGSDEKSESTYITNIHAQKEGREAEVTVELTDGTSIYGIHRVKTRSGSDVRILRNGSLIGEGPEKVFDIILRERELAYQLKPRDLSNLFTRSILLEQDEIAGFIREEKPHQRFDSLSKMLGTSDFDAFCEVFAQAQQPLQKNLTIENERLVKIDFDIRKKSESLDKASAVKAVALEFENEKNYLSDVRKRLGEFAARVQVKVTDSVPLNEADLLTYVQQLNRTVLAAVKSAIERQSEKKSLLANVIQRLPQSQKYQKILSRLSREIVKARAELVRAQAKSKGSSEKIEAIRSVLAGLEASHKKHEGNSNQLAKLISQVSSFEGALNDAKSLRARLLSLRTEKKRTEKVLKQLEAQSRVLKKAVNNHNRAVQRQAKANKDLGVLLARLKSFIKGTECPVCSTTWPSRQELEHHIDQKIGSGSDGLGKDVALLDKAEKELHEVTSRANESEQQLESIQKDIFIAEGKLTSSTERAQKFRNDSRPFIKRFPASSNGIEAFFKKHQEKETVARQLVDNKIAIQEKALTEAQSASQKIKGAISVSLERIRQNEEQINSANIFVNKLEADAKRLGAALDPKRLSELFATMDRENGDLLALQEQVYKQEMQINTVSSRRTQLMLEEELAQLAKERGETQKRATSAQHALSYAKKLQKDAKDVLSTLNQEKVERYLPAINELYSRLCPHPFFKTIDFKFDANEYGSPTVFIKALDVLNKEIASNAALTFSQSQVNVLALCVFLAMNGIQNWCSLRSVLIDDPVQNMDSLNVLRFIDVVRTLAGQDRQIILSTQDPNFKGLMIKKFRRVTESRLEVLAYEGCTREGPKISPLIS